MNTRKSQIIAGIISRQRGLIMLVYSRRYVVDVATQEQSQQRRPHLLKGMEDLRRELECDREAFMDIHRIRTRGRLIMNTDELVRILRKIISKFINDTPSGAQMCSHCLERSYPVDEDGNDLTGIDLQEVGEELDHADGCVVIDIQLLIKVLSG